MDRLILESIMNTTVSFATLIVSIIGVWYGRKGAEFGEKGYKTAEKIFKEGVQLDCDKVFAQLGLEITMNIIIPFEDFEKEMKKGLYSEKTEDLYKKQISEVYRELDEISFNVVCPYWDTHKGDIWDAFEKRKKERSEDVGEISNPFWEIRDFIEKARSFQMGINYVKNAMKNAIHIDEEKMNQVASERGYDLEHNKTIKDFLNLGSNIRLYQQGEIKMKELKRAIKLLPAELKIQEKKDKLCEK